MQRLLTGRAMPAVVVGGLVVLLVGGGRVDADELAIFKPPLL